MCPKNRMVSALEIFLVSSFSGNFPPAIQVVKHKDSVEMVFGCLVGCLVGFLKLFAPAHGLSQAKYLTQSL